MPRSLVTIDLAAIRHNARVLLDAARGAALWAVVKADGYGHGAGDAARVALEAGASALCVATVGEALILRPLFPASRIIVLGPAGAQEVPAARDARLELVASTDVVPQDVPVHLKLDTGMGRWGLSELIEPGRGIVGLMSHFASADADRAFTERQLRRFLDATAPYSGLTRHIANSAATLRYPAATLDAVRCGIALYGISPFGGDPRDDGLRPALRWDSEIVLVRHLAPGEGTGYGQTFVASKPTWIGLLPLGYADGFRRDMTGTDVLVGETRCRIVGTVSMDAVAVELSGQVEVGTPVTLIGDGVLIEEHARVAGTIGYEIACGLNTRPPRVRRELRDE